MIRFKNDTGNGFLTEITNAETGEDITKLLSVEYGLQITVDMEMVKAQCRLMMVQTDIVAEKTIFETLNPVTKKYEPVSAIEFRDGSRVEIAEDGTPSVRAPADQESAA